SCHWAISCARCCASPATASLALVSTTSCTAEGFSLNACCTLSYGTRMLPIGPPRGSSDPANPVESLHGNGRETRAPKRRLFVTTTNESWDLWIPQAGHRIELVGHLFDGTGGQQVADRAHFTTILSIRVAILESGTTVVHQADQRRAPRDWKRIDPVVD